MKTVDLPGGTMKYWYEVPQSGLGETRIHECFVPSMVSTCLSL